MENKVTFSISLLFFWIKGFITVDSTFIKTSGTNTLLGFIPAGKQTQSIPLKNVSSAAMSTSYKIKPLIFGVILFFIGLSSLRSSFILGIILLLLGFGMFGNGILSVLIIQRSGNDFYISVPFYEKSKLLRAQDMIEEGLAKDTEKTDLNLFFDKKE